jgi:hypothetical protein
MTTRLLHTYSRRCSSGGNSQLILRGFPSRRVFDKVRCYVERLAANLITAVKDGKSKTTWVPGSLFTNLGSRGIVRTGAGSAIRETAA